ncbi:MAG: 16S rRNA (uracil(1498)-N(3))-methyltransferase [Treponema sp.]|jgi:RsmE family RNA methyltransferase|nr:16S rRNA (uracil(1498)-N(3))-methyltransferase [Treponema sp.]
MNLILFEPRELGKPLSRRDDRTIHLLKVLRKKAGDFFEAGILGGCQGTGRIEKINLDGSVMVSLNAGEEPPPRLPLRVGVGFPRPIQLRRLLRDLSSLGVEAVDLLGTELGEKSYRDTKLLQDGGAKEALVEGAVQARDTTIPELSVFISLEDWLRERPWDKGASGSARPLPILAAADNVRPEGAMARLSPTRGPMVLAVGAERGWSDRERDALEAAGFLRLSLGSRALRTETACVAAAVLALEKIGELD